MPKGMMTEIRRIVGGIPAAAFGNTPAGEIARFLRDLDAVEKVEETTADLDP